MAISSYSYFNSKSQPIPTLSGRFNKFAADTYPKYPLGFKVETSDGSVYRYTQFGADTNRGVLVSTDISETGIADTDNSILAPASTVSTTDGKIGSRFVEITAAGITANEYAGGKFITTDDTGEGYTYDIKGNTATDNPASGTFRLELHQPLQVALDATTDYSIAPCLYSDVETATAGTDDFVVGVSCANMTTATTAFGWIQTKGVVAVLQDAKVPTVGQVMVLSHLTNGAVGPLGGTSTTATDYGKYPIVGYCVDPGDSTGHSVVKINLE